MQPQGSASGSASSAGAGGAPGGGASGSGSSSSSASASITQTQIQTTEGSNLSHLILVNRPDNRVTWDDGVIDNEHMNKRKSKKC